MVDSLLPGCLPWHIISYATGATDRTDDILNSQTYASLENMEAATCCLSIVSPSTLLDCPTAYQADKDTNSIKDALLKHKASKILLDIIRAVHMRYRSYLKVGRIALFGGNSSI